jgi:hypothetical protein
MGLSKPAELPSAWIKRRHSKRRAVSRSLSNPVEIAVTVMLVMQFVVANRLRGAAQTRLSQ